MLFSSLNLVSETHEAKLLPSSCVGKLASYLGSFGPHTNDIKESTEIVYMVLNSISLAITLLIRRPIRPLTILFYTSRRHIVVLVNGPTRIHP